jgi:small-conductance mechanosensitive channel
VETYLSYLTSLLLLGLALGCHALGFRDQLRSPMGRALQRAGKLRMLGVALLGPLSLLLWLEGDFPLILVLANQLILYWLASTMVDVVWLTRTPGARFDWRLPARILFVCALTVYTGRLEPAYRDFGYALAATAAVALVLLRGRAWLWASVPAHIVWMRQLRSRLRTHGYLLVVLLAGYYLLRAWTVVPITSDQLRGYEALIGLVVGLGAVELLALWLETFLKSRRGQGEFAHLAGDAVRAVLYCSVAISLASALTQRDLSKLVLTSAFFSVGLGFALKPTLGNLVSGLILRIAHDFTLGDFLQVGSTYGRVAYIDWRSIGISTLQGDVVSIPHSVVAKSMLMNFSRPTTQHAGYMEVQLSRSVPPGVVRRELLRLLADIPEVCAHPAPEVYLMNLDGWAARYRIRWWMEHVAQAVQAESAVRTQLMYGLQRENLQPITPVRVWHGDEGDGD